MLNISDKFKELATAGGREPFCVIKAGDKLFFDDSIKSFELQEVIFPEELTFGTACSSRFQFKLFTDENIPLSAEIRPYIGFGEYSEDAELCPLGVFHISKRYRRFSNYSITCYDRMYRLEDKYVSELKFPASAADVLNEICEKFSLEFTGEVSNVTCEQPPANETVRNVLGYLAGLGGCCAVFDREGRLCFRKISDSGYRITRDNYTSMDLKQDPMEVKKIVVSNDKESFEEGEGSRLDTYEVYNPFADKRTASLLYNEFGGFYYYGLELDMQGLPYLEAGDVITVQNDTDDGVFTAVIGELDFVYDGSFWLTLTSRSKNPVDESEDKPDEESVLEQLEGVLQTVYYSARNEKDITVGSAYTPLVFVDVEVLQETCAVLGAQLIAQASEDCTLTLICTLEDKVTPPPVRVTLKAGEIFPVCIHNFFEEVRAGYVTVRITGFTDGGRVLFAAGDIVMTVAGQYLAAASLNRSPNRTVYEEIPVLVLEEKDFFAMPFQEQYNVDCLPPVYVSTADRAKLSLVKTHGLHIGFTESGQVPEEVHHIRVYSEDDVVYADIVFTNPVFSQDFDALAPAFAFEVYFSDYQEEHGAAWVKWDGNAMLTLASDTKFVGTTRVNIRYNGAKGDLIGRLTGAAIGSFDIAAQVEELL